MKVRLLLLSILFLSVLAGCKKDSTNEDGNDIDTPDIPQQVEEDLSYVRVLESKTFKKTGSSSFDDVIMVYKYDGNKLIGKERYVNGIMKYEHVDFEYTNLSSTWTYRFYNNNETTEASCYAEYTDESFMHIKYEEGVYSNGNTSKSYYEFDENKIIGQKHFTNDKLTQETFNYQWDSLKCSCTTYAYDTATGDVRNINEHITLYNDNTYLRPSYVYQKSISYFDGNEHISITETFNQYEEKKIVGKKEYMDGVLREEHKDYVYDGDRCSFKQLLYDKNGELIFEGEGYTVYYNR